MKFHNKLYLSGKSKKSRCKTTNSESIKKRCFSPNHELENPFSPLVEDENPLFYKT